MKSVRRHQDWKQNISGMVMWLKTKTKTFSKLMEGNEVSFTNWIISHVVSVFYLTFQNQIDLIYVTM